MISTAKITFSMYKFKMISNAMKFTSGRLAPILNNQIILGSVSMKISGSIISFSEDPTFSLFNE